MKHLATIFSIRFLGAILGISFSISLARILGANGAGIYFQALNVAAIATILGRLGLDNAALKYTAIYSKESQWHKVNAVYIAAIKISLPASLLSALIMYLLSTPIALSFYKDPDVIQPIQLMSLSVVPFSLLTLHAEMLKGLERTALAITVQTTGIPLISLPILLSYRADCSVTIAIVSYLIGVIVTLLISRAFWTSSTKPTKNTTIHHSVLLQMAFPLLLVASMGLIMGITDSMMLAYWMDSSYVGIYGVIAKVVFLSSTLLVVVNSILAPKIASYFANHDYDKVRELLARSIVPLSLIASMTLATFFVFGEQILAIFGTEFIVGYRAMIVLAIGQFIVLATGPTSYTLMMTGREKEYRNIVLLAALTNIVFNVLLIPQYQLIGAATATALSLAIKNIFTLFAVYWHLTKVQHAT